MCVVTDLVVPPPSSGRARMSWRSQVLLLLVLLVIVVLAVAMTGILWMVRTSAEQQKQQEALAIARSVASDPRYAVWVTTGPPVADGPVARTGDGVRARTGALYVVVTDLDGVRYSHPVRENIGAVVSTDFLPVLAGEEVTAIEEGTLGHSARGKTPLRDAGGTIVGTVSVGVPMTEVDAVQRRLSAVILGIGGFSLLVGLAAAGFLWRRLRTVTHGLSPEEMADLLRAHAAVLGGTYDGVVAVDTAGRVRVYNEAARRYVGTDITIGLPAHDAGLPPPIVALLDGEGEGRLMVTRGRALEVRRLPVERAGRDLGAVVVLRDRTDLDELGRELEATRALTDALRAQTHEHTNRLHALSGMLQLGHTDEATEYLEDMAGTVTWQGTIADPYLAGLLSGKVAAASEQGVDLRIADSTWVPSRLAHPLDTVTVVGNLVDNAIRAAADGPRRPAWVEVSALGDGDDLVVHVIDSGEGVRAADAEAIYADGWTTKEDDAALHGVGLALARVTARRHGGDVELVAASGDGHGAAFRARLAGVGAERVG